MATSSTTFGQISRRAALGALAAGTAGFLAFGPRGQRDAAAAKGRLVIDYWEKWTSHEGAAMQRVVDTFNAMQSRIYVRYVVASAIHQKAMIAIAGGNPPDLIGLYSSIIPSYAEAGALRPLNGFADTLASTYGITLDSYARGMQSVMTHGTVKPALGMAAPAKPEPYWWGVINTGGTLAMYYNRTLFRKAGLDPDRPPRNIAEMDAANAALTTVTNGQMERAGFLHMEPGWWSWIWGYHFGGTLYDQPRDVALANTPANAEAYAWLQAVPRKYGSEVVERFRAGFGPFGTARQAFLTGEVAMAIQGPWMANQIKAFAPDMDYGVCPMPVHERAYDAANPVALIDTDVLVLPAGGPNPEAALEFLAFTQRQDNVEALATAHCKGSPLKSVSEGFIANHPNRGVRLHTQMADSTQAFLAPRTPAWTEYWDLFNTGTASMWKLQDGPSEVLATIQSNAQGAIDRLSKVRIKRGESRM